MQIANQPPPLHITHNVFDGCECLLGVRFVTHRKKDAGDQLQNQHHHRQNAKHVQDIEILSRVILCCMLFEHFGHRKSRIDPINQLRHIVGKSIH